MVGCTSLFLDEPTIGLDAVSKIAVRDFILDINKNHNTTVILTTHDMQDIEALTKRIILIGKGKILMDGNLNDMKHQFGGYRKLTMEYVGGHISLSEGISFINNTYRTDEQGMITNGHAEISIDTDVIQVSDVIAQVSKQVDIKDIVVTDATIDEVVVKLYQQYEI